MEIDNDSKTITPDNWDAIAINDEDGITTDEAHTGEKSVVINGDTTDKHFGQVLNIEGKAGTSLKFSGWSKSKDVSVSGGYYQVLLKVDYKDEADGEDWFGANITKSDHGWEYTDGLAVAELDFDSVTIYGKLENQPNAKAYFDDFSISLHAGSNALMSSYNIAQNSSFEYDRDSSD